MLEYRIPRIDELDKIKGLVNAYHDGRCDPNLLDKYVKLPIPSWLAWDGDRLIGAISIYIHNHNLTGEMSATKYGLFVLPEYQGKGVGRKLISLAKDYARKMGCKALYIDREPIKCVLA